MWLIPDFPTSWKTAVIIPVPKLGKVLSDPGNYRPIALTSCLCKAMERMVNSRLTWYLDVSIFFDLEKAYDTAWKYGILLDLYKTGLCGRSPIFICDFFF